MLSPFLQTRPTPQTPTYLNTRTSVIEMNKIFSVNPEPSFKNSTLLSTNFTGPERQHDQLWEIYRRFGLLMLDPPQRGLYPTCRVSAAW